MPSSIGVILRDQHGIAQVRLCNRLASAAGGIIGWRVQQVAMCCESFAGSSTRTTT